MVKNHVKVCQLDSIIKIIKIIYLHISSIKSKLKNWNQISCTIRIKQIGFSAYLQCRHLASADSPIGWPAIPAVDWRGTPSTSPDLTRSILGTLPCTWPVWTPVPRDSKAVPWMASTFLDKRIKTWRSCATASSNLALLKRWWWPRWSRISRLAGEYIVLL